MALKRKRTSATLQEWMECGTITYNSSSQVHKPLQPKYLVVAYDPESHEDYPMYAEKAQTLIAIKTDLSKRGQKIVEVINL